MIGTSRLAGALALLGSATLYGCGGGGGDGTSAAGNDGAAILSPQARVHDTRTFTVDEAAVKATLTTSESAALKGNGSFLPLGGADTDRWAGVLAGSGYQIEVPRNWNGILVMYAHGYRGEGPELTVAPPSIRRYLVDNGYAWAASSYSKNSYDVRAGIEDTNALALSFRTIAGQNGRMLAAPRKTYIIGHSMGGHIAAAAVDQENIEAANNKVAYNGAVPMCGVLGDTQLFDFFAAYQLAAQQLAGQPATAWPVQSYADIESRIRSELFFTFPSVPRGQGDRLRQIVENLTGGNRPLFPTAFALPASSGGTTPTAWSTFGSNGTVNGILNKNVVDTRSITYQLDNNPAVSAEEQQFNATVFRVAADPDANPPRPDGLRWIPKTNARIGVPVVTIHTIGDMYVPFSMEQIFRRRADALGTSQFLVQRAIRGVTHCDFTVAEEEDAFDAMAKWEQNGVKPQGDDVLTAATLAAPTYGCRFSRTPRGEDSAGIRTLRTPTLAACLAADSNSGPGF